MGRAAGTFRRREPKFSPEKRILVLCEDTKSGKQYLEEAAEYFRASLKVDIAHAGVTHPSGIIEHAIKRQTSFDEVYCTIDRDSHNCFDRALDLARHHKKITVIPSYPCFEFWILLHFGYCRKPFNRTQKLSPGDCVVRELRNAPGMAAYDKGKHKSYFKELLGEPFAQARRFAPQILKDAEESNQPNPSTTLHLLIDRFEQLSEPQV